MLVQLETDRDDFIPQADHARVRAAAQLRRVVAGLQNPRKRQASRGHFVGAKPGVLEFVRLEAGSSDEIRGLDAKLGVQSQRSVGFDDEAALDA